MDQKLIYKKFGFKEMNEFIGNLSTGFVMAVIIFLLFLVTALMAAVSDLIIRFQEKNEMKEFLARNPKPIGRVTGYWVCSYGYQPKNYKKGG